MPLRTQNSDKWRFYYSTILEIRKPKSSRKDKTKEGEQLSMRNLNPINLLLFARADLATPQTEALLTLLSAASVS